MKLLYLLYVCSVTLAYCTDASGHARESQAVVLNNLANVEQQLARSGHGAIHEADQIKASAAQARQFLGSTALAKVDALMEKFKKDEQKIIHSEASEARHLKNEAQRNHATTVLTQEASGNKEHQEASSKVATAAAAKTIREVRLAAGQLHLIKELDQAQSAVAKALGKQAPQVEAEVEKYLSQAKHQEENAAQQQFSAVQHSISEARKAGVSVEQLQRSATSHPRANDATTSHHAQKAESNHKRPNHASKGASGNVNNLAAVADKELRNAELHLKSLKASEGVDRTLIRDLQAKQPLKARRLQRLLKLARVRESQEVRQEFKQAKRDWKEAVALESENAGPQHNKKHLRLPQHHPASQEKSSMVSDNVAELASMADQEARSAHEGLQVAEHLKILDAAIGDALTKPSLRSVRRVRKLMKLAQMEQAQHVRENFKEAAREWKSAIAAETAELRSNSE